MLLTFLSQNPVQFEGRGLGWCEHCRGKRERLTTLRIEGVWKGPNLRLAKSILLYYGIDFCCVVVRGLAASSPGPSLTLVYPDHSDCLQSSEGFSEPTLSQAFLSFWVAGLVPLAAID